MKLSGISKKVFLDRYSLKSPQGKPIEKKPEAMWRRVAKAVAGVEKKEDRKKWEKVFYQAMKNFTYVPAGRVLAGAGSHYEVTYYNCFVIPSPKDSRGGILETLKQMVEIMARGGGVGINLSSLRPRGARVRKVNGYSSGPINWAELFSITTKEIIQQGGCFSGETLIMTHSGLVPIEEIIKTKKNWLAATHKGYQKVTTKFNSGIKNLYEIKTKAGYRLQVTAEHRLITANKNGQFSLKKMADFKVGETVVLLLNNWPETPYVSLNINLPKPSKYSSGLKKVNLPLTLNENLAFLIGVYDADGSKVMDEYSSNGKGLRIALAANRPQDLKKVTQTIKKVFKVVPKISQGDGAVYNVQIFSRRINEFLKLNGLLKESSAKVKVPNKILTSPRRVVEAYISGVFLGDGTNRGGKGGLRISSISYEFVEKLQLLLLNLGVAAKIVTRKRKYKHWKTIYTLTVNGHRFMKKFQEIISDYTEKAFDKNISVRDGAFNWPFNLTDRFSYMANFQRTIARSNPTTSQKAIRFLQRQIATANENDKEDIEFLNSCIPDKIASIKPVGKRPVYDLEVENVHLLSGNGFYTSNSRRGALMLMLWDWHPDIEEFITVKENLAKINGANLSIAVSNKFMEAVKKDTDWPLVFPDLNDPEYDQKWNGDLAEWKKMGKKVIVKKVVKARKIWNLIAKAAWQSAEPGVVFMERYNQWNNNYYWTRINCVNPCGEEGLPPWGVCNLGSINLSTLVKSKNINEKGKFDYRHLKKLVRIAVRFQDNLIEMDPYFFNGIKKMQLNGERRIGIGTMGLGDTLIKMHLRYGSSPSLKVIDKIYKTIRDEAYKESIKIAAEKGSFPKFDKNKYPKGRFIQTLPKKIQEEIKRKGIRNSLLLMQAPTGSTSLMSGVTSGIEPVFAFEFIRKDRLGTHIIKHPLWEAWSKKIKVRKNPLGLFPLMS